MVPIGGRCDDAFGAVRAAFAENFDDGEVGAACTISVGDSVVVDLWGGWTDDTRTRPWARDTIINAYSVGKPLVALMLLQCVARGDVNLDTVASTYWPELIAGQWGATVRHALCHRAGVPAIRPRLTNDDLWTWARMCEALAATEPWWTPGTKHVYHTNTYGHLVGELSRRVDGRLPGTWLREEIAGPLDADLAWGVDAAAQRRCATVVWEAADDAEAASLDARTLSDEQEMVLLGYFNPPGYSGMGIVNTSEWRATQVPSTNLHATARGVARVYAALAHGGTIDDVRVLDRDVLAEATSVQSEGWCPVLDRTVSFGLGFQPTRPERPFGPNTGSFGHFGTGGSLGFADPIAGVGFGYVMNAVRPRWQSPRNRRLVDALYSCL
ncbi:MAG TPA: serine hydrolase domain-containing protein [Acidimicrobiia bacterium]|nr:serine hydrolase domain-containing protein [Acidimicrobiia bacterium]